MDNIRIYDRALSADEISTLYDFDRMKQYSYDANGNMTYRDGQVLTWDDENRLVKLVDGDTTETYIYDADGVRVQKVVVTAGATSTST